MWGRGSSRTLVIGTALAAFVVVCLLPPMYMLVLSVAPAAGRQSAFAALLLDTRQRELLANSALLGAGTAILATLVGVPLGLALARIPLRRKAVLRLALVAPVLLPPYVAGLAWIYLGGSRGLIAAVAGRDLLSDWTYSLPGAVIVLGLALYPLSMLATEVAMRRIDGRLEEAALLVAAPGRTLRRITLPLAAPSILAAALVVFVLAISELGVPGLLRVRVYTTEVFTAFAALYDFGRATLLALPLLLLSIAAAVVAGALGGERLLASRRGAGVPPLPFEAWRRPAGAAVSLVVAVALLIPLAVLGREALGGPSTRDVLTGSRDAIRNSLVLAATGATAITALAVWIGYARARSRPRVGRSMDVLLVVLFALPSTVVGVGLIGLWNRPGPLGAVYGTNVMILLAYLARLVPVAALALAASVRLIPASQEEAAAVSGAGWLRTMMHIVFPQIRHGLAAAWVVAFILAFGELGATILVAPAGEATLPIRIYTIIANTPSSHVAALALLQTAVILVPLAALGLTLSARENS